MLKPCYNILPLAGNSFGYKHTLETLKKIRDNYNDIRRNKIGSLNKGKSLSNTTRELIRKAALIRPPMSQETKNKCKTNKRPVTVRLLSDNTLIGHFEDIISAAKHINCGEKTIRRALKANGIVKNTYIVKDT